MITSMTVIQVRAEDGSGTFVSVEGGSNIVLRPDGSVWVWGRNDSDRLGTNGKYNGIFEGLAIPYQTLPLKIMDNVTFISNGYYYVMAIKTDRSLWGWGHNASFEFHSKRPEKIMDEVAYVSAGIEHYMVIKTDGSLWGCGENSLGELGDGTREDRYIPVKIMEDVVSVYTAYARTVAVKADGSLWTWGGNFNGQIGDGTAIDRFSPVRIMENVDYVSVDANNTFAIKTDGSLWGWGRIGIEGLENSSTDANDPEIHNAPVKLMDDVASVSNGWIIKKDGSLWVWGHNFSGSLGDGTKKERRIPIKIMEDVVSVSSSGSHTMAIKKDGSLWGWGANRFGQFGNGGKGNSKDLAELYVIQSLPVKIMSDVTSVYTGDEHTIAVKTDGSIWAWGYNFLGQLGDGTTKDRSIPVKVMAGKPQKPTKLAVSIKGTEAGMGE